MKTKILYCCILGLSLGVSSCSDFLDEDPKGKRVPSGFFASAEKMNSGVYALYTNVQQSQTYTNMLYPQWQGDDMAANPGSNKQAVAELDGFSSKSNNKGVKDAWSRNYAVIKSANLLIEQEGNEAVPEAVLNEALGNAYFWRAHSYFYLVRIFGELPLITSSMFQDDVKLSSIEDVYTLIVSDLKRAEELLPTSYTEAPKHIYGVDNYVTKQACQATMTAVYMAMAGYPLNKGQEYYKMAAEKAKAVLDGNYGFYLEPEWNQVYSMGHNYNKATILGIPNSPQNGSWDKDSEFTSCCRFEGLGDGGWGDVWGEIKYWTTYPEGPRKRAVYAPKITFEKDSVDKKRNKTVYYISKMVDWWEHFDPDTLWKDKKDHAQGYTDIVWDSVQAYHPMFSVFTVNADEDGKEVKAPYDYTKINYRGMTNGARHRIIRYSELLLWYAECLARTGGDLNLAKNYLKQVHNRACDVKDMFTYMDGTEVNIDDMTAEQVAKACVEEHGWEVAGYWVATVTRRADELRMNELKKNFDYRVKNEPIVVAVKDGKTYKAKEKVAVTNATWQGDKTIYLPYPDTEVEKNPNLVRK